MRRHGTTKKYGGSYPDAALRTDARRARGWLAQGRDVYAYFNNDGGGAAVRNARRLREMLRAPASAAGARPPRRAGQRRAA